MHCTIFENEAAIQITLASFCVPTSALTPDPGPKITPENPPSLSLSQGSHNPGQCSWHRTETNVTQQPGSIFPSGFPGSCPGCPWFLGVGMVLVAALGSTGSGLGCDGGWGSLFPFSHSLLCPDASEHAGPRQPGRAEAVEQVEGTWPASRSHCRKTTNPAAS